MFAGVAPFSIMIAKYANPKIVYAIDKNEYAVKFAKQNIKNNNVLDKIEVIHADAKEIYRILNQKNAKVDRVIMNLPFSAHSFFTNALGIIGNNGVIHYYDIQKEEKIHERINKLKKTAKESRATLKNLNVRKIKTYAPREFYIGLDITVRKNTPM
jgi:tRNA (guanine37-N1)-methyltransferase